MAQGTCKEPGCERFGTIRRGWCDTHYIRWRVHGDPTVVLVSSGGTVDLVERFWAKVDKDGPVPAHMPHLGQCWVWTGCIGPSGYGALKVKGKKVGAHRVSWVLHNGPIPPETPFVLHHCDNPLCVRFDPNPLVSHLRLGTAADNAADMVAKGRSRAKGLTTIQPCGTSAAAKRHRYYGEPVCEACRLAENAEAMERARRRRKAAG